MTFALPIALALAALALPIIVFYILKLRLRRVPVSTNLFWKQIFDEKPPRSLWKNFRHLLSLLLQLLMLLLLILSIADPYFPWQLMQARKLVIVIDHSASMRANDIEPSRFEAARQTAREIIAGMRFRDEVAIVLAGQHPEVAIGMTSHNPTLRRTIDSLSVSDLPTELKPAIELGKQLIGDHAHGQVIVLTDGCVEKLENPIETPLRIESTETISDKAKVVFQVFGSEASNVGITQFQVRRSLIDPIGYEALAAVTNASATSIRCRLELTLDDVPIDVLPLDLKPGETWSRSIEKTSLNGGRLMATLTQIREEIPTSSSLPSGGLTNDTPSANSRSANNPNALTTDDSAWAILPPRHKQKVLIVTRGNLFLQKVFEANPLVEVEVRKELPNEYPVDSIVVLHSHVPAELPPGNLLVIDPDGPCNDWEIGPTLDQAIVTDQDKNSPLMTHIRLDNVIMPQAKQLQFKTAIHVLASTVTGDPIYAELKRTNGKCLVLSVNLEQSDLAFRTAFPIMVTNSLGWFAGETGELQESLATGGMSNVELTSQPSEPSKVLMIRSPSGIQTPFQAIVTSKPITTTSPPISRTALAAGSPSQPERDTALAAGSDAKPSVAEEPAASADGSLVAGKVGPLNEIGIWNVVSADGESASATNTVPSKDVAPPEPLYEIAVNLSNARESDLRPSKEFQASNTNQPLVSSWLGRPVWFYLIFIACALTTTEWFLYQRRLIT
ncbi:MAG: VWA domain-containing protein [Pirellulaceae bacterium]|nr:VWA domain-containing protein [Pirellulaceae bacterium]